MTKVRIITLERARNNPEIIIENKTDSGYNSIRDRMNCNGWIYTKNLGYIMEVTSHFEVSNHHKYECCGGLYGYTSPRLVEEIVECNTEENRTEILGVINRR